MARLLPLEGYIIIKYSRYS